MNREHSVAVLLRSVDDIALLKILVSNVENTISCRTVSSITVQHHHDVFATSWRGNLH